MISPLSFESNYVIKLWWWMLIATNPSSELLITSQISINIVQFSDAWDVASVATSKTTATTIIEETIRQMVHSTHTKICDFVNGSSSCFSLHVLLYPPTTCFLTFCNCSSCSNSLQWPSFSSITNHLNYTISLPTLHHWPGAPTFK